MIFISNTENPAQSSKPSLRKKCMYCINVGGFRCIIQYGLQQKNDDDDDDHMIKIISRTTILQEQRKLNANTKQEEDNVMC